MTTPTTTSGHATRRKVLDALADLNPPGFPDQPLACCSGCSWAQARRASVAADTLAFFHDQGDEASFEGTEYRYFDADGQLIESIEETDEDAFFAQPVYHDDDLLLEPLYLHWQGDPTAIEAVLRKHGLRYVAPESDNVCFEILPGPAVTEEFKEQRFWDWIRQEHDVETLAPVERLVDQANQHGVQLRWTAITPNVRAIWKVEGQSQLLWSLKHLSGDLPALSMPVPDVDGPGRGHAQFMMALLEQVLSMRLHTIELDGERPENYLTVPLDDLAADSASLEAILTAIADLVAPAGSK